MQPSSLDEKLKQFASPVDMLRNSQVGAYVYPIPNEFSNWRDEQKAWRETALLFDQSYHMTDVYLEGPDVVRLLSDVGVNSFNNFVPNKAKQIVVCSHDGYVIGDCIIFFLAENKVSVVGRPPVGNWIEFQVRTGKYDVSVDRDERSVANSKARRTFRYQIQGPNAEKILAAANGGSLPHIKFFNIGELHIAGHQVRALKHGMVGAPGLEIWGPSHAGPKVRAALMAVGEEFGLKASGSRAYATAALEAGWIPSPIPAIYTGEKMRAYREYLPASGFEANSSLGGSFYSANIEDYYLTPWDLGYGGMVKFDHDFIGREALERRDREPKRSKVTLVWNKQDVLAIIASMFDEGEPAKYLEWPASHYATTPFDEVKSGSNTVGLSTYSAYNVNERSWVSLAMVDEAHSTPGTEVTLIWGEKNGGSSRPPVERHKQMEIRAVVGPCPYAKVTRELHRLGTTPASL